MKYELIPLTDNSNGKNLYAIKAKRDIYNSCGERIVKKGEIGGMVEKGKGEDDILAQDGRCWIEFGAIAINDSRVKKDAYVGEGVILEHANVSENTKMEGRIHVSSDEDGGYCYTEEKCAAIPSIKFAEISGDDIGIYGETLIGKDYNSDVIYVKISGKKLRIESSQFGGSSTVIGEDISLTNVIMDKATKIIGNKISVKGKTKRAYIMTDQASIDGSDVTITAIDFTIGDNVRIRGNNHLEDYSSTLDGNSKMG